MKGSVLVIDKWRLAKCGAGVDSFRRWGGGWEGTVNRGQAGKAEQQQESKRFRVKVYLLKKWHYSIVNVGLPLARR